MPRRRSLAQRAMEAEPVVRIYESRWWRRSPLVGWAIGISFEAEYALILGAAELRGSESVLDLAGGPGIYARPFARLLSRGRVVDLDLSPRMLAYARRRADEEGLGNLFLVRGDAGQLPFASNDFDVVNCCGALHLFPDVPRALAEVHRVLRPGGRLTLAVFRRAEGRAEEVARRLRKQLLGVDAFTPDGLGHELEEAGFERVTVHHARRIWLVTSARKPS